MPIYEYECRSCGSTFELLVRLPNAASRDEAAACPSCQGRDLQQLISGFSVSSAGTRQMHLNQARRLGQKERRDKQHAEIEREQHHDD
jgi:putative FmdB family regulatory protein